MNTKIGFSILIVAYYNAGQSIVECSKGSILQYFRPSLSYHFPLQVLLY